MGGGIHPPDRVILSWPNSNYVNPVTRGPASLVVVIVLGVICIMMVSTRLIARAFVQHNFGIDDWVILAAMIPTLSLAVGICLATQVFGFDRHVWDIPYYRWADSRKIEFANEFLYIWASGLIKISILLFYKRMTTGTFSKKFIYIIWAAIAFVVGYIISFTFTLIFGCSPIKANWLEVDQIWILTHKYKCLNEPVAILSASSVALLQDFMTATLPMALFWGLEIPKRQKIALVAVFSVGYFLVAVNAVRMYYIWKTFYATYDTTWTAYDIWLWTAVEILVAPMCASAPALKVFFRGVFQERTWGTWSSASRRSASRGWQRTTTNATDEHQEEYNKEAKEYSNTTTGEEEVSRPLDSPTLGTESGHGVEMDYFKSTRDSRISDTPLSATGRATPQQRSMTKAERTLGL